MKRVTPGDGADDAYVHLAPVRSLPINEGRVGLRNYFNARFPNLNVDPADVLGEVAEGTLTSLIDILELAGMHPNTLARIHDRKTSEFKAFLTTTRHHTAARFVIEQGTGHKMAVIPAGFLSNIVDQVAIAGRGELDTEQALRHGARISLMYTYGLLVFDSIDPWRVINDDRTDNVSKSLAASLLCTGMPEKKTDVPGSLIAHYMESSIANRFASTLAYIDFERFLRRENNNISRLSTRIVDRFIQRRVESIYNIQRASAMAISDADEAFAQPLVTEEFGAFVQYASMLHESLYNLEVVGDEQAE